jgi:hypothetical protein
MYDSSSEEEIQEVILVRRQRNFRLRTNFHFHAEYEFNERFRLRAENIETILNEIGKDYSTQLGGIKLWLLNSNFW